MKGKQYGVAMECFEDICTMYKEGEVDSSHESLLIAYSNFLLILKKIGQEIPPTWKEDLIRLFGKILSQVNNICP